MVSRFRFETGSALVQSFVELINALEDRLELREPIRMYIAGGMAVHLYTALRVTTDVDAEFSKRFLVPHDLMVETRDGGVLYIDPNYNSSFALMHEDYLDDAQPVAIGSDHIEVYVLSPVDLIVSKIARFSDIDQQDIKSLIWHLRIGPDAIRQRAEEAMGGYVGNMSAVRLNLAEVLRTAAEWASIDGNGKN